LRNNISISLTLSAALALVLLASPLLPLSNPILLQPAQAQTPMTFKTPKPATGTDPNSGQGVGLTFDAHGTSSTSDPSSVDITNGTIQLQADPPHGQTYNGTITSGIFTNNTNGGSFRFRATIDNSDYSLSSDCSTSVTNNIQLSNAYGETDFSGAVECSSSSSLTGSSQGMDRGSSSSSGSSNSTDSDRDGIPDSSDNCTHNSNHRCYKEGDTSNTTTSSTTQEQEQPSSSSNNRTGNQTR